MNMLTRSQAYRAWNRALAPIHDAHAAALEVETRYDCGEWSLVAIDEKFDELFDQAERRVLRQLGYTSADMHDEECRRFLMLLDLGIAP